MNVNALTAEAVKTMTAQQINKAIHENRELMNEINAMAEAADFAGDTKEFNRLERLAFVAEDNIIFLERERNARETAEREAIADRFGVSVHTVDVLRDIETLTDDEAVQIYTAEELAEAERLARMEDDANNVNTWDMLRQGAPRPCNNMY